MSEPISKQIPSQFPDSYLGDITGKLPLRSIGDHLEKTGILNALPEFVKKRYELAKESQEDGVHQYLCNLDKESTAGSKNACTTGKTLGKYSREVTAHNQGYILEFEVIPVLLFGHELHRKSVTIPRPAQRTGKNLTGVDGRFRRIRASDQDKPGRYNYAKVDPGKVTQVESDRFADAVESGDGRTIGQRALFYGSDGKVLKGTAAIERETKANQLSANTATLNQTTGTSLGAKPTAAPGLKADAHPNKKNAGQTTDKGGSLAGMASLALLAVGLACLMPLHFVTSAITFINTIVTFLTTTRSAIGTYLGIADGVLGVFGIKNSTDGLKSIINSVLDNAFGKENIQYAKAAFAGTLNSVGTGVKLLEKIQQSRAGTDNKIDDLALGLGTVNNALKDSGIIPPDSPYMQQSKAVDRFVADRTAGEDGEALKDNISHLVGELKTHDEVDKDIKDQREKEEKKAKKIKKETEDTFRLIDSTKTNVEAIKREDI
jgi:hypothetical protein